MSSRAPFATPSLGRVSLDTGRVFLDEMDITEDELRKLQKINIAACGTSWHAALAGKFMIERLARIPVDVDYASEFRYRDPHCPDKDTDAADHAIRRDRRYDCGAARSQGQGLEDAGDLQRGGLDDRARSRRHHLTHAGPEIGVASTKAFTAQLTALFLLALYLGAAARRNSEREAQALHRELAGFPAKMERSCSRRKCEDLAQELFRAPDFLYLGRGIHYPIALEGALKLKEISYIHAEGYPAGEMKHGPNALIDENLPVVVLATRDRTIRTRCCDMRKRCPTLRK